MPKSIYLSKPGSSRFIKRNLEGHEPCHDFNPPKQQKRLAQLNLKFKSIINLFSNAINVAGAAAGVVGAAATAVGAAAAAVGAAAAAAAVPSGGSKIKTQHGGGEQPLAAPDDDDDSPTYLYLYLDTESSALRFIYTLKLALERIGSPPESFSILVSFLRTNPQFSYIIHALQHTDPGTPPNDENSPLLELLQNISESVDYLLLLVAGYILSNPVYGQDALWPVPVFGGGSRMVGGSNLHHKRVFASVGDDEGDFQEQELPGAVMPNLQRMSSKRRVVQDAEHTRSQKLLSQYQYVNFVLDSLMVHPFISPSAMAAPSISPTDSIGQGEWTDYAADAERISVQYCMLKLKELFNYYIEKIDGDISPFSVINSDFVKDGMFVHIFISLCENMLSDIVMPRITAVDMWTARATINIKELLLLQRGGHLSSSGEARAQTGGLGYAPQHGGGGARNLYNLLHAACSDLHSEPNLYESGADAAVNEVIVDLGVSGVPIFTNPQSLLEDIVKWGRATSDMAAASDVKEQYDKIIEEVFLAYYKTIVDNVCESISGSVESEVTSAVAAGEIGREEFNETIEKMRVAGHNHCDLFFKSKESRGKPQQLFRSRSTVRKILDILFEFIEGSSRESKRESLFGVFKKKVEEMKNFLTGVTVVQQGAANRMDPPFSNATNQLLIQLCKRLHSKFPPKETGNQVYNEEHKCIEGVAKDKDGYALSSLDEHLFDAWRCNEEGAYTNCMAHGENYWPNKQPIGVELENGLANKTITQIIAKLKEGRAEGQAAEPLYILNNAGGLQFVPDLKGVVGANIDYVCHSTCILDAQGTTGSCYLGTVSPNYVNGNMDISVYACGDDGSKDDSFMFSVSQKATSISPNCTRTKIRYTLQIQGDGGPEEHGDEKTLDIKNTAIVILSAANTFAGVLDLIENAANTASITDINTIFKDTAQQDKILNKLAGKYIGDGGQEQAAILTHGGFENNSIIGSPSGKAVYKDEPKRYIVMTNGDRPSMVRACCMFMTAQNGDGINDGGEESINTNAQILYTTKYVRGASPDVSTADVYIVSKTLPPAVPAVPAVIIAGGRRIKKLPELKLTLRKRKHKHKTQGKKKKSNIRSKIRKNRTVSKKRRSTKLIKNSEKKQRKKSKVKLFVRKQKKTKRRRKSSR